MSEMDELNQFSKMNLNRIYEIIDKILEDYISTVSLANTHEAKYSLLLNQIHLSKSIDSVAYNNKHEIYLNRIIGKKIKVIDKNDVYSFLDQKIYLKHNLLFIIKKLSKYFPDYPLLLKLRNDEDTNRKLLELYIDIGSQDIRQSLDKMDKFEKEWWSKNAPKVHGNITILLKY